MIFGILIVKKVFGKEEKKKSNREKKKERDRKNQ